MEAQRKFKLEPLQEMGAFPKKATKIEYVRAMIQRGTQEG
jgi:hypothetical protein